MRVKVNSADTLSACIGALRQEYKEHRYLSVSISTGKARTISQNALAHAWFSQVSKELGEYTEEEVKCLCKLHVGIPILRGEDAEFNDLCASVIDVLCYESRVLAMKYMPVTSMMSTKQLGKFLENVQKNYSDRVNLTFPEDI